MSRALSGSYLAKNPEKYVGTHPIVYRSSWELAVMRMCDANPSIIQWASESIKIPYVNPLTAKQSVYVPDFTVLFEDKNGNTKTEVWEIKPRKETFVAEAKSQRDRLALAINAAKWKAAQKFCSKHGMQFRVINEDAIFRNPKRR